MYNTERTSKVKRGILVALMIACLIAIIGGTYARYTKQVTVNATTQVAAWAVKVKSGDTELTNDQNITFVVQSNTNVVPGKIAPGVTATATVDLDLTGTEVAVDFSAVVNSGDLLSTLGATGGQIDVTSTVAGENNTGSEVTIPLVGNSAFTSENGKKTVVLTLTWTNNEANNTNDTTIGETKSGATITIPVTLTAKQHIGA
jgi:hypothetical protein